MIISTEIAVAISCPRCGKLLLERYNFFQLNNRQGLPIVCECGARPGLIGITKDGSMYLDVQGECCEESHDFVFYLDEFNEHSLFGLACDTAKIGLGFVGSLRSVLEAVETCRLPVQL